MFDQLSNVRQLYPQCLAFVIDKATSKSVHTTRFAAADPLTNFVTFSRDTETTNKFRYDRWNRSVTGDIEPRTPVFTISRSILVPVSLICMLFMNWALTVGTLHITLVVLVREMRVNDVVLVLPIAVVVTVPTLRALFVGRSPFSILLGAIMFNIIVNFLSIGSLSPSQTLLDSFYKFYLLHYTH